MTDKELLELAAKAAGVVGKYVEDYSTGDYYGDQFYTGPDCGILTGDGHLASVWNPLADDGDALRLAVRLKMCIDINWLSIGSSGDTMCFMPDNQSIMQSHGGDPYAATRRAIVMAAAEIGRSM